MKNVITFGTFDLFHYGHLRILERAASLGDKLIVGVSSDSLNFAKKHRYPIYSEQE
ncbi:adenylyltransferase/cytidyltransferase family protein, partial [Campylobacter jejuni]